MVAHTCPGLEKPPGSLAGRGSAWDEDAASEASQPLCFPWWGECGSPMPGSGDHLRCVTLSILGLGQPHLPGLLQPAWSVHPSPRSWDAAGSEALPEAGFGRASSAAGRAALSLMEPAWSPGRDVKRDVGLGEWVPHGCPTGPPLPQRAAELCGGTRLAPRARRRPRRPSAAAPARRDARGLRAEPGVSSCHGRAALLVPAGVACPVSPLPASPLGGSTASRRERCQAGLEAGSALSWKEETPGNEGKLQIYHSKVQGRGLPG